MGSAPVALLLDVAIGDYLAASVDDDHLPEYELAYGLPASFTLPVHFSTSRMNGKGRHPITRLGALDGGAGRAFLLLVQLYCLLAWLATLANAVALAYSAEVSHVQVLLSIRFSSYNRFGIRQQPNLVL